MSKITYDQLCEAHDNWCNFHQVNPSRSILTPDFLTFVGIVLPADCVWVIGTDAIIASVKTVQYVKALTSPHWYAMLKAHEARKP